MSSADHFGVIMGAIGVMFTMLSTLIGLVWHASRRSTQLQDSVMQATRDIASLRKSVTDDLGKVNDRLTWLERTTHRNRSWGHWN